jgi:hypothetical protein
MRLRCGAISAADEEEEAEEEEEPGRVECSALRKC